MTRGNRIGKPMPLNSVNIYQMTSKKPTDHLCHDDAMQHTRTPFPTTDDFVNGGSASTAWGASIQSDHGLISQFKNGGLIHDQFVCWLGARPPFTKPSIAGSNSM